MKIVNIAILALILFILIRFVFVVREINCVLPYGILEDGVCDKINNHFKGNSLIFTDFENASIWDELLVSQEYGQAYQYQSIVRSLSGEVDLILLAKLPDYRLVANSESYLLNNSSKLRNDQADLQLPTIEASIEPAKLEKGYLDDTTHKQFFSLAEAMREHGFSDNKVKWLNDEEINVQVGNITVILDNTKNFNYQLERLRVILNDQELKETLQIAHTLDLRFNLPVLKQN